MTGQSIAIMLRKYWKIYATIIGFVFVAGITIDKLDVLERDVVDMKIALVNWQKSESEARTKADIKQTERLTQLALDFTTVKEKTAANSQATDASTKGFHGFIHRVDDDKNWRLQRTEIQRGENQTESNAQWHELLANCRAMCQQRTIYIPEGEK